MSLCEITICLILFFTPQRSFFYRVDSFIVGWAIHFLFKGSTAIVPKLNNTWFLNQALGVRNGNNHFLLHVAVQSVLQIDGEVEVPEMSGNPTQSIRFMISSGGTHIFWPWYYILYYMDIVMLYNLTFSQYRNPKRSLPQLCVFSTFFLWSDWTRQFLKLY